MSDKAAIAEYLKSIGNSDIEAWRRNGVAHLHPDSVTKPKSKTATASDLRRIIEEATAQAHTPLFVVDEFQYGHLGSQRKFRADYAIFAGDGAGMTTDQLMPLFMCEFDGGTWMKTANGRSAGHSHPLRFESDCYKLNHAALVGVPVFRFTPNMVARGDARRTIRDFLERKDFILEKTAK